MSNKRFLELLEQNPEVFIARIIELAVNGNIDALKFCLGELDMLNAGKKINGIKDISTKIPSEELSEILEKQRNALISQRLVGYKYWEQEKEEAEESK